MEFSREGLDTAEGFTCYFHYKVRYLERAFMVLSAPCVEIGPLN